MAEILEYLRKIKAARYGRDVRDSIHDGIKAINEEVETNTLTSNEAVESANNAAESADISARQATESANQAQASANSAANSAKSAETANNTVKVFVSEKTTEITEALNNVQKQTTARLDSAEQKYNELSDNIQKQITEKIGIDDNNISSTTAYSSAKIHELIKSTGRWCYSMHIGSDSDSDTAVTYIGANANFAPAKMNYDTGVFDWGSWANAPFLYA